MCFASTRLGKEIDTGQATSYPFLNKSSKIVGDRFLFNESQLTVDHLSRFNYLRSRRLSIKRKIKEKRYNTLYLFSYLFNMLVMILTNRLLIGIEEWKDIGNSIKLEKFNNNVKRRGKQPSNSVTSVEC